MTSPKILTAILIAIALLCGWSLVNEHVIQPANAAAARVDDCLSAPSSMQSSPYGPCR